MRLEFQISAKNELAYILDKLYLEQRVISRLEYVRALELIMGAEYVLDRDLDMAAHEYNVEMQGE